MPKVTCPECGCWALVLPRGETRHLFAGDAPEGCARLRDRLDAGEMIRNLLDCEEMAAAAMASSAAAKRYRPLAVADTSAEDPLVLWRNARHSRRQFLREPIKLPARLAADGTKRQCALEDLSPQGALISLQDSDGLDTGTYVALTPEGYRTIPAEVRHIDHSEDTAGLMLLHGPADQVDLAQWFTSLEAPAGSEFRRAV